jgi:Large polyvalent protein associated domain 29
MTKYLSVAETAKLVRSALKESFPRVKFSVRSSSYAGGASIYVRYTDGASFDDVNSVCKQFEGAYFDGMIDYQGYKSHRLDGEKIHFGASYVFCSREYSEQFYDNVMQPIAKLYGVEPLTFEAFKRGEAYLWGSDKGLRLGEYLSDFLRKTSLIEKQHSPTLDRIKFIGDDGYGHGCVGNLEEQVA